MLAALVITAVMSQAAPAEPVCDYDRTRMLAMTPSAFDQDLEGGWRTLSAKAGCEGAAADLIADYRRDRWAAMSPEELHANYWHEGQLRAGLGAAGRVVSEDRDRAIRLLMAGVRPDREADGFEDYALGTIAFLLRDRDGLQAARDRLAARPPTENWPAKRAEFKAQYGVELVWPLNLGVLDGLLACFDRPYNEAYGAECRASARAAPADPN